MVSGGCVGGGPGGGCEGRGVAGAFGGTDLRGGLGAGRMGPVSSLGKLIDPLADSISRFSVFLAFTTEATVRGHFWPVMMVAVVFYRDALVAYTRTIAATSGTVLAARFSGKLKAVIQGGGILIFLAVRAGAFVGVVPEPWRQLAFYVVMAPIVLVTAWSAFDYLYSNWGVIAAMAGSGSDE